MDVVKKTELDLPTDKSKRIIKSNIRHESSSKQNDVKVNEIDMAFSEVCILRILLLFTRFIT